MNRSRTWLVTSIATAVLAVSACTSSTVEERLGAASLADTPPLDCTTCTQNHRTCDWSGGGVAVCGGCQSGFTANATEQCVATAGCTTLDCGPSQCAPGQVWDDGLGKCRAAKTCASLTCAAPAVCQEATTTTDAFCGSAACPTPPGSNDAFGFYPLASASTGDAGGADAGSPPSACVVCGFGPACLDPGETGNLLATSGTGPASCVCEVSDGYFLSSVTGTTVACDADGDGWVNENAQEVRDNPNPVLASTARCHVRTISKVILENENHQRTEIPISPADFPAGLPLYESERNDTYYPPSTPNPVDTYRAIGNGKLLNSFTKVCASGDFNDNGTEDVAEEYHPPNVALGPGFSADRLARKALVSYYKAYMQFGYFLELHNGWYEPPASGTGPGAYHVQERLRTASGAAGVPIVNKTDPGSYWNECPRHVDAAYSAADAASRIGGDFSLAAGSWGEMAHHSQFKCVQILPQSEYQTAADSEITAPELVFTQGPSVARATSSQPNAPIELLPGTFNDACTPDGTKLLTPPGPNPSFPAITCAQPLLMNDTGIGWVSVGGNENYDPAGHYVRGCTDLCKEPANGACGDPNARSCSDPTGLPVCAPVDQCANGTLTCPTGIGGQKCVTNPGSPSVCVSCGSGYRSDGKTCSEVMLCAEHLSNCQTGPSGSICVRYGEASYGCQACGYGYQSDGYTCSEIDVCAAGWYSCDPHAHCYQDGVGHGGCSCDYPWTGPGNVCYPPNPCLTKNGGCNANATCTNHNGTASCACKTGYTGDGHTCTPKPPPPPPTCQSKCNGDPTCICMCARPRRIC